MQCNVLDDGDDVQDAMLFRKKGGKGFRPYKPKDNRDKLLFDVTNIVPPPKSLGRFRLEPVASCGDIVECRGKVFVIKKVFYRYTYTGGAYRMVGKAVHVKETSREAVEQFMQRVFSTPDQH
eukprot:CAMPEP_0119306342 /NCGR_PEP_ID=MMETSP1333-20130426/7124_1 /TAXON_ID=418940 /ORGANISM="Scyphosphaera apsteinii, Strain RCC1455" /LENGTH=121 /DNA_ID=CAMNT_0007309615 /DNA_START=158 /DNA_END=523 /DNA_ORIENTATION=-